jgi:two-component system, cell cycle response regulator
MSARILVIEDNAANLDLMTYLLQAFGYTPLYARDGEEGIALALRERPDLIICDLQLPRLDGYGVVHRLRQNPALRVALVIAVTAFAMVGDRDKVLSAGFDGYLAKPINPETFVSQIETFLGSHLRPAAAPARTTFARPPTLPTRGSTILVVDNTQTNLDLARSILTPFGYTVMTAAGMREALACCRQTPPDLILSDVRMLGGSGFDFIQRVKADPALEPIPFIFISSTLVDSENRAYGVALGADRFLVRPLEPQVLLGEIAACLEKEGDPHGDDSRRR